MSHVVGIVQARMGSTRLPGKSLMDLGGKPMLLRVLERLVRATRIDEVVVATTDNPEDQVILDLTREAGFRAVAGDEEDVLARYAMAARESKADVAVRVTADCPIIDPSFVDDTIALYFDEDADYAANCCVEYLFPRGSEVEVFSAEGLAAVDTLAQEDFERVHVTPYFYRHPERFKIAFLEAQGEYRRPDLRVCVDMPEDLELVRALYERLDTGANDFTILDVIHQIDREPVLKEINAAIHQKKLQEG
jgi:spore coat polysaccharide biosynthesis protein SpsF